MFRSRTTSGGRAAVYLAVVSGATWEGIGRLAENPALRPFVVDACSVNRATPEVRDNLIAHVLASGDRRSQALLVNLILQKEPAEVQSLLVKLEETLPHETIDGQRLCVLGTGSLEMAVHFALFRGRDIARLRARYVSYKAEHQLDDFFRMEEKNHDLARVKGWLLYRYHAAEFSLLLDDMKTSTRLLTLDRRGYLAEVLKAALEYASLVSPEAKECRIVRQFAAQANSPEGEANAMIVMEHIVSNEDVPLLRAMAAKPHEVIQSLPEEERDSPFVAMLAVHRLVSIRSAASLQALQQIADDVAIASQVRNLARTKVAELTKAPPAAHAPKKPANTP